MKSSHKRHKIIFVFLCLLWLNFFYAFCGLTKEAFEVGGA